MTDTTVCALYKFVALPDFEQLRDPLKNQMDTLNVRGTVLLAVEGINGTIAGNESDVLGLIEWLKGDQRLTDLEIKVSLAPEMPFKRGKVKLKKEIVTMGVEGINPRHSVGTYVDPTQWNDLIADPEVTLIDCRNDYEIEVGTFEGAINPDTTNFRELPQFLDETLSPDKHKKVAMFCTGGIRCEKSTAYLKQQGFEEVYHLKGGILKYIENVSEENTLWNGECFVFDERVTVNHQLEKGSYDQCHACRMPITEADKDREEYTVGISCHHCHSNSSDAQKAAFAQRQKQIELSKQRGQSHMGQDAAQELAKNKIRKQQQIAENNAKQSELKP
ncbi:MAG: UPF0176 protein [Saprospiraceae bacterium]|jgi:UPF0176 protein